MSDEPFPLTPVRRERRGEFPEHSDVPQPLLTAEDARQLARIRLEDWITEHGD